LVLAVEHVEGIGDMLKLPMLLVPILALLLTRSLSAALP